MTKDTIAVCISQEIIDFVNERIETKQFADTSHAFELMAYEYMKNLEDKDTSTIQKLERMAVGGVKRSIGVVKDTAGTVQDSTMKVVRGSSERVKGTSGKVKESGIMKGVIDTAGKVQESTVKAVKFSTEKVKEGVGKVKDTVSSKEPQDDECEHCEEKKGSDQE